MNLSILHSDVQEFICDNLNSDITKLILKGSPFKDISVQELVNQIIAKQKSEKKIPTWFSTKNIYYPQKISVEQTSSEITAKYKSEIIKGTSIIDITGGFGVDCFYFSKKFKNVIHCEINNDLSTIVKHNYKQLNVENCTIFSGNGTNFLKETSKNFDCIYIDPSRRNDVKGKVFLLKDCQPYISPKIDFFFSKANCILIKVSPILDISQTINELKNVKEIHIIAINNEVKELLFLLEKDFNNSIEIKTINIKKDKNMVFNFRYLEKVSVAYSKPLAYLYEPNSAILKSGGFLQVAYQLNISKLHQHSHLYTSDHLIDFPGRIFKIEQILNYDKKKIKRLLTEKKANITTRNFPKSVAQIRKETKIKEGGNDYLFFTTNLENKLIVILATRDLSPMLNK